MTTDTFPDRRAARSTPLSPVGRRRELLAGAVTMLPITVGYVPFALLVGAAVAGSTDPFAGSVATPLIFGGTAHFTVLEMIGNGSSLAATVGAALLINLRLVVYSTALSGLWGTASKTARLLAAATVIDPTWMVAERRRTQPGSLTERRAHYAGAAAVLAIGWCGTVAAGAVIGANTDLANLLGIATPLCLVAMVVPQGRRPGGCAGIAGAAAVAWFARGLPAGTGSLLAMATAAALGHLVRARRAS